MSTLQQQADAAYQKKVVQRVEQAVRFLALAFYTSAKYGTPVDTGRARSNWHVDNNVMEVKLVEPGQGQTDDAAASVAMSYKIDQTIYISNNLPYIRRLNEGHTHTTVTEEAKKADLLPVPGQSRAKSVQRSKKPRK